MKQSWQNNIDFAFKCHISVNRHVAKNMLDHIAYLEKALQEISGLRYRGNATSDIMRDMAGQALHCNTHRSKSENTPGKPEYTPGTKEQQYNQYTIT